MSKTLFTKYTCIALLFALASCNDNDVYQGEKKNKPLNPSEVFGFDLTKQIKLNVDYNFTNLPLPTPRGSIREQSPSQPI